MNDDMKLFPQVENLLDWTAKRQKALSANVANIDTPGYRATDVEFSEQLKNLQLETTDSRHITTRSNSANSRVYEVGTAVKPNGNSVDLDHSMTELSKNGLQYLTLIQYVNQKLRTVRSALNDGGKV
jgi:flagellar basal-body rod protein FlgB